MTDHTVAQTESRNIMYTYICTHTHTVKHRWHNSHLSARTQGGELFIWSLFQIQRYLMPGAFVPLTNGNNAIAV